MNPAPPVIRYMAPPGVVWNRRAAGRSPDNAVLPARPAATDPAPPDTPPCPCLRAVRFRPSGQTPLPEVAAPQQSTDRHRLRQRARSIHVSVEGDRRVVREELKRDQVENRS